MQSTILGLIATQFDIAIILSMQINKAIDNIL